MGSIIFYGSGFQLEGFVSSGTQVMLRDSFGCQTWGVEGLLLASRRG